MAKPKSESVIELPEKLKNQLAAIDKQYQEAAKNYVTNLSNEKARYIETLLTGFLVDKEIPDGHVPQLDGDKIIFVKS